MAEMRQGNQLFVTLFLLVLGHAPPVLAQNYVIEATGGDLVGEVVRITIDTQETLADVARDYNLGHEEIRAANPEVDFWLPARGAGVVLPNQHILPRARREGIVLNVPEMRLYYFPVACIQNHQCAVITHPVSIGQMDWKTPLGTTRVTSKATNPSWRPTESIRREAAERGNILPAVVPPGPDNPMGAHAIYLDLPDYRIHGTNRPYGVGMRVTHGCVRMYPEDIKALYGQVAVGTSVQIVNQPVKFGWQGDQLFMEVHPPLEEDELGLYGLMEIALDQIAQLALERPFLLLNETFEQAIRAQNGIPIVISTVKND
jgi:L,D-transpeptidase ErfK/SrfK